MTLGMELKYESEKHKLVKDAILERAQASERKFADRYTKWEEAEKHFQAYVKETDADATRRQAREGGTPQFTTVTIPYSYATLLTAHTYWSAVFLNRSPVFQYTARHGEAQHRVQALEALIDYQLRVGSMLVPLYNWLMDAGKYGIGIIGNYWANEQSVVSEIIKAPRDFMGIPIPGTETTKKVRRVVPGYQGNRIFNVRPYDFLPDPRVSVVNLQDGEFCGRRTSIPWNEVKRREAAGNFFNVKRLREAGANYRTEREERGYSTAGIANESADFSYIEGEMKSGRRPASVEAIEMIMEIIPQDYGLGQSDYPEKWAFTLGFEDVIIGAQPLGADHDKFPYFIQSYEFDPYSHTSRGAMEILKPLNDTIDWLFNSHIFNVRKSLNDQFLIDPSRVREKDFRDGGPGIIARLRPSAYGQDVRTVVSQLPTQTVTTQHLRDVESLIDIVQRVSGVSDNLMGMVNPGGRKTATEVRSSSSAGVNRLKTIAEYNSALGWDPLSQVLVQNSQQDYDLERQMRIVGDLMMGDPKFLMVNRDEIQGFFDFVPVDGTFPVDRFAQANLWKEILGGVMKVPQIAMQYDLGGIFVHLAQLAGLKDITQYKLDVQPDQLIQQQAEAGNVVPMRGGGVTDLGVRQAATEAVRNG